MKKLTDFELAGLSTVPGLLGGLIASVTDIWWAFQDFHHTGLDHLMPVAFGLSVTIPLFLISGIILWKAINKHRSTGKKVVQSIDDIDYRIALYIKSDKFKTHIIKEKAIHHKAHRHV